MPRFSTLTLDNLGGVQTRKALTAFKPWEATSCVGGLFNIDGAYTKRRGGQKYNTTALSSISGLYDFRYNNDGSQEFIITAGTNIYKGNGGSPTSIKSGMTSGTFYDFATYDDRAFIVNSADAMVWYDGTNVRNAGITAPATVPTLAANTSGSLPLGTYLVNVTYENALGEESNPKSTNATITLTGVQDQIDLSSIPTSSDAQVTKRNIYMTSANGAVLSLQQTINDNTTTTGTITTLPIGRLLEYDHDVAPTGLKGIIVHKERLMAFKNNEFHISHPTTGAVYFPQGTLDEEIDFSTEVGNSDPITAIISFFDIVLIFKKYDIYYLSGSSEIDFRIDRVRSDERVGCVARRTLAIIGNYCHFLGVNGVYRTNGLQIEEISNPIGDFFDQNSADTTYKINKTYIGNACALYFNEKNVYLLFCAAGSGTDNNMCFAMDTDSARMEETGKIYAKWNPWPGFTTQASAIVFESGTEKWFRGDSSGYVYRQETLDGDGSNVTSTTTSATSTTLTDSTQSWTTNLYSGLRVNILSGTGVGQERTISSNTATVLTVSSSWTTIPDTTSKYTIGGPPYHYQHGWHHYGDPNRSKRLRYVRPRFETSGNYGITASYGFDFAESDVDSFAYDISGQTLWDQALWDVGTWDGTTVLQSKISVRRDRIHRWANFKVENNAAGQPLKYFGHDRLFQMKGVR